MKLGFNDPFGDYLDGLSLSLYIFIYLYVYIYCINIEHDCTMYSYLNSEYTSTYLIVDLN